MADLVTFTKEHAFFINNTFISNSRLKLTKNKTNAKQHPEAKEQLCLGSSDYPINRDENEDENEKKDHIATT